MAGVTEGRPAGFVSMLQSVAGRLHSEGFFPGLEKDPVQEGMLRTG